MKQILKGGLISLFFLLLLFGGITLTTLVQSQANGKLINYVGIVRGATQRLVKLELANQPSDKLVGYLDEILEQLNGKPGQYDLPCPDDLEYQQNLFKLNQMWDAIKVEIIAYRSDSLNGEKLLSLSEQYFEQANVTVFSAEAYFSQQMYFLQMICVIMLGIMILTGGFIFWAYAKNLLILEGQNKKLSELARQDALTGCYLFDAFKEEAQRLLGSLPEEKFAVVYTDFADFKYINDVFGYDYGDKILAQYGELLRKGLRKNEVSGRVSADNFVLLLCYEKKEEIASRQREIDQAITGFMHISHSSQSLPTCCGICCTEDVIEDLKIDGFLDRANFARKTVKTGANLNYVYYDESIRRRLWEERDIEGRMQGALKRREFKVYYQPKVDLKTGKIGCAEALVRWQPQTGTIISPDKFIPVFERKFLIDQLDLYVFEEVCRWIRRLLDQGIPALPVSVNVSRLQFYDLNFVKRYVGIRDQYAIPPGMLEIEFTESIAFDNSSLLVEIVDELKQAGFTCSIDDFGKGYSSLGLLKSLPIDTLKIDSLFFANGPDKERDLAVVQSIIKLVQKFHIQTVAEGIESSQQVDYLKSIGCDYIQGYVFYRPMPQEDYEKLLQKIELEEKR